MDKLKIAGLLHVYQLWCKEHQKKLTRKSIHEFLLEKRNEQVTDYSLWFQVSDEASKIAEKYLVKYTEEFER